MGPLKPLAVGAVLAAVLAAADTTTAHADDDRERAVSSLGWRYTVGTVLVDGERRFGGAIGVSHGFTACKVRVATEYLIGLFSGSTDDTDPTEPAAHGTAYRGNAVARLGLWTKPSGRDAVVYLDGELGAELMLAFDSHAGRVLVPSGVAGLRFGFEMMHRRGKRGSPSRTADGLISFRVLANHEGRGLIFSMGVDFGR